VRNACRTKNRAVQSVRRGEKLRRRVFRRVGAAGFTLLVLALALAAGYAGGSYGHIWIEDRVLGSSFFSLREVHVTGNQTLSEDQILREADVRFGDRLMAMDLEQIRNRLLENVLIRDAAVIRRLPSEIVIRVEERTPAAVVRAGGDYIVDHAGFIMSPAPGREAPSLPCLAGLRIQEGRIAPGEMPDFQAGMELVRIVLATGFPPADEIDCVDLGSRSDAVIVPAGKGPVVHVGRENILERLTRWRQVAPDMAARWEALEYIDLRADGMVVAKPEEVRPDGLRMPGEDS